LGVWAPEGRWFFFSSFGCGPALHRYDAHTREILHGVTGGGLPEWSRDGQTVVWTTGSPERWFEVLDNFR
jgi:hypothetical protein